MAQHLDIFMNDELIGKCLDFGYVRKLSVPTHMLLGKEVMALVGIRPCIKPAGFVLHLDASRYQLLKCKYQAADPVGVLAGRLQWFRIPG